MKKMKRNRLTGFCVAMLAMVGPLQAADVTVVVKGVEHDDGSIMAALHDGAKGFPGKRKMFQGVVADAEGENVTITFTDVPPGEYAVALFHDEDDNEKMKSNLLGMPKEGFGFSNDASAKFGPPSFKDAMITVGETDMTIEVNLNY